MTENSNENIADVGDEDVKPSGLTKQIRRLLGRLEEKISTTPEERKQIREYDLKLVKYLVILGSVITIAFLTYSIITWEQSPHCLTLVNVLPICNK